MSVSNLNDTQVAPDGADGQIVVGDTVIAADGPVGRVEHVLRTEAAEQRFVVVVVRRGLRRRHPVVPVDLVAAIDRRHELVRLRGSRHRIMRLPESLPLLV